MTNNGERRVAARWGQPREGRRKGGGGGSGRGGGERSAVVECEVLGAPKSRTSATATTVRHIERRLKASNKKSSAHAKLDLKLSENFKRSDKQEMRVRME